MLTRYLAIAALCLALLGVGYGAWQGRTASQRLVEIGRLAEVVREKETALRAATAARNAVSRRLVVAEQLNKEKADDVRLDQEAIGAVPDWANVPIPDGIRGRLRDD